MLRITFIMITFVLTVFLTHCNNSYAKFESISIEGLVCSQASTDFESLLNLAVKNGVHFQFSKPIWKVKSEKKNIEILNNSIKLFIDKHEGCLNKYIPELKLNAFEENPVIFLVKIMNSKYFYSFQRNQPIVKFYLNDISVDKNEIDLILKSLKEKNDKSKKINFKKIQSELSLLTVKYNELSNNISHYIETQHMEIKQMKAINFILYIIVCGAFIVVFIFLFLYIVHKIQKIKKYLDSRIASKVDIAKEWQHYNEIKNKIKKLSDDFEKIKLEKRNIINPAQPSVSIEDSQGSKSLTQNKTPFELESQRSINKLLDEYHHCLDKGKEKLFIDKWNPIYISLKNLADRRENSLIPPKFEKVSSITEAQFWVIQEKQKDKNWILLPAKHLYKSNALTSAGGRGADLWIKGIFDVVNGDQFRVVKYALIDNKNNITKGEISLPTPKSKKENLPANDESSNFGIGR